MKSYLKFFFDDDLEKLAKNDVLESLKESNPEEEIKEVTRDSSKKDDDQASGRLIISLPQLTTSMFSRFMTSSGPLLRVHIQCLECSCWFGVCIAQV